MPADDPEKLKQVLLNYFEGIKNRDFKKMIEATTDDFLVYEEGKVWNNDSVFKEMKRLPYTTANFKFDNFKINIDSRSGHMSYFEQAQFVINDSTKFNLKFLGSAAFKKNEKGWKMSFLHSTDKYVPKNK
jgi:ketosteroid isomerase-like protein